MSTSVLIAYSTRAGSTKEVAEAIGAALREAGFWPDVLPMHEIQSFEGRDALILGAPLYMGGFPSEFRSFAKQHRAHLASLRSWCFVLGPTRTEPADFEAARKQAEKQLTRYPWIKPVELHIFGGRWSTDTLPFPMSLLRRLPGNPLNKIPMSDVRDWDAIRAWALDIACQLKPAA